ncbi:DoxX family membrane protein [Nesterenkonia populi]|uniref:DoxX family membrane protein n=1 Tax=Nesterenkonia populi TaxID=1591087 RepID=UPI0011BF5AFA|nr:DoxX family membrane protein [Nesterenkonia populi]
MTTHTQSRLPVRAEAPRILIPALYLLAVVRILLGFEFLWAFLDKTFGWQLNTPPGAGWIDGGSPTEGYLSAERALEPVFSPMAGATIVDILFMVGLLCVGIGLMLGIAVRLAAVAGALMQFFMWLAAFPIEANPFVNYNLTNAIVILAFAFLVGHMRLSLAQPWQRAVTSIAGEKGAAWLK